MIVMNLIDEFACESETAVTLSSLESKEILINYFQMLYTGVQFNRSLKTDHLMCLRDIVE